MSLYHDWKGTAPFTHHRLTASCIIGSYAIITAQLFGYAYASPVAQVPGVAPVPNVPDRSIADAQPKGSGKNGVGKNSIPVDGIGWVHCFARGSAILQESARVGYTKACVSPADSQWNIEGFNYGLASSQASGKTQTVWLPGETTTFSLMPDGDGKVQQATLEFTAGWKSNRRASQKDCEYAYDKIIYNCYGDNADTQGGWFEFAEDWAKGDYGTSYRLDVGPANGAGIGE